jgi:hypothetical protein
MAAHLFYTTFGPHASVPSREQTKRLLAEPAGSGPAARAEEEDSR